MTDTFNADLQRCFIEEATDLLDNAERCFLSLESAKDDLQALDQIFRLAHNLKGSAKAVGFEVLGDFTHDLETFLLALKSRKIPVTAPVVSLLLRCNDYLKASVDALKVDPSSSLDGSLLQAELRDLQSTQEHGGHNAQDESVNPPLPPAGQIEGYGGLEENSNSEVAVVAESQSSFVAAPTRSNESIRVNLHKIDELLNSVGELVIHQTVMNQHKRDVATALARSTIDQMTKIVRDVQGLSMGLRMIPMRQTFQKMQRIVRDVSKELAKDADLTLVGEDTEIDKTVLEKLSDPLVHLVRNAVDHGLEDAEQRRNLGKPARGKIILSAYQHAGSLIIEIKDDGKGLDAQAIRTKAVRTGLIKETQTLSDSEIYQLIFAPGFSTKEDVTDISGRGVGMNVVKTNITQLQGQIDIASTIGHGTKFRIALPLTLAIIEGVVIRLEDERFVVPLSQVTEFFRARTTDVTYIRERSEVITLRKENLPAYRLSELFKRKPTTSVKPWDLTALIAKDQNQKSFAVLVDEVVALQQVVIKPVGDELKKRSELKGSAILGDGKPALIVDLMELTHSLRKAQAAI